MQHLSMYFLAGVIWALTVLPVLAAPGTPPDPKCYVYYVLNISDFRHVDLSAAALQRLLELFRRHQLGLDLYFTEPVLKALERHHPGLLAQIKAYPKATINYHLRPPHPCDRAILRLPGPDGRCRPLADLDRAYVRQELNRFESFELVVQDYDFRAKNFCPRYNPAHRGGFDYVRQVFGVTPIFLGRVGDPLAQQLWAEVLRGKGAQGIVAPLPGGDGHRQPFRRVHGLLARPADFDCIFSEIAGAPNPYAAFLARARQVPPLSRPIFGNVLVHDYDFYHRGTWTDDEEPTRKFGHWKKSAQEQAQFWQAYEQLVAALARDPGTRIINAQDILALGQRYLHQEPRGTRERSGK